MSVKLSSLKNVWKTVIGLEIHAQLNTKTKLFSVAPNVFRAAPNSNVAYFDMATPGTLPILNSKCVELAIVAATLLKCDINFSSEFDRKHYFYCDMPAGYQITQYYNPIGRNGKLKFIWNSSNDPGTEDLQTSEIHISQIQIEQDSGKALHDYKRDLSLIDLNRAGVGLLEIVTDCQFKNAHEAVGFVKELRDLFLDCGICSGHMEQGELRVDVNISVNSEDSTELGVRSEVKNINSFRGVLKAIEYESKRHIDLLEKGEDVINETRFYDPITETTFSMRDKENIQDYRYFPEPNLPPLRLQAECITKDSQCINPQICVPCIQNKLKNYVYFEEKRRLLMSKFSLRFLQTNTVLSEPGLYNWIISVSEFCPSLPPESQNKWFKHLGSASTSIILGEIRNRKITFSSCPILHQNFADLITLIFKKEISLFFIDRVLKVMMNDPSKSAESIVLENNWKQINDVKVIEEIVEDFVNRNPKALKDYKLGNKRVIRFFKNIINSKTGNVINPKILNSLLFQCLDKKE